MAAQVTRKDLVHLYRQLLRSCQTYPSKNRAGIYESIREDFRLNKTLDPASDKAIKQMHIAFKGIEQLHQFDGRKTTNFSVTLEQNPFPKPDNYDDKRRKLPETGLEKK